MKNFLGKLTEKIDGKTVITALGGIVTIAGLIIDGKKETIARESLKSDVVKEVMQELQSKKD